MTDAVRRARARPPSNRRCAAVVLAAVLAAAFVPQPSHGADPNGLTRLEGPKGGVVVYGPAPGGAASAPAAMGAVLRALHAQFGTRPDVGRVIEL